MLQLFKETLKDHFKIKWFYVFLFIVLLGFVKQIVNYTDYVDSKEYQHAADNLIANGDFYCGADYSSGDLDLTKRTPGYPLLYLLCFKSSFLLLFIQNVLLILSCLISSLLLASIFQKTETIKAYRFSILFYCMHPLLIIYSNNIITEIPVLFLVNLLLYHRFITKKTNWITLIWVLLVLLKPAFVPALIAYIVFDLLLFLIYRKGNTSKHLEAKFVLNSSLKNVFVLGIVALVSWFNLKNTGVYHYSSISVTNFYGFNGRAALIKEKGLAHTNEMYWTYERNFNGLNFEEKYHKMKLFNAEITKRYLGTYLLLHFKGSALMLLDPGRFDFANFTAKPLQAGFMGLGPADTKESKSMQFSFEEWIWIVVFGIVNLVFLLLTFFGALQLWKMRKTQVEYLLFILLFLFFVLIAGPVGSARYLVPAFPAVILMSFVGWNKLFNKNYGLEFSNNSERNEDIIVK